MSFPSLHLAGGDARLTVIPALGGKISSMHLAAESGCGQQGLHYRAPGDGTS